MTEETVDHPPHYNSIPATCRCGTQIECIQVVEHMSFNTGNAMKYLWRHRHKGRAIEDLQKSLWYIEREIAMLECERSEQELREIDQSVDDDEPFSSITTGMVTIPEGVKVSGTDSLSFTYTPGMNIPINVAEVIKTQALERKRDEQWKAIREEHDAEVDREAEILKARAEMDKRLRRIKQDIAEDHSRRDQERRERARLIEMNLVEEKIPEVPEVLTKNKTPIVNDLIQAIMNKSRILTDMVCDRAYDGDPTGGKGMLRRQIAKLLEEVERLDPGVKLELDKEIYFDRRDGNERKEPPKYQI